MFNSDCEFRNVDWSADIKLLRAAGCRCPDQIVNESVHVSVQLAEGEHTAKEETLLNKLNH